MSTEKKKTIIITIALAVIAILLIGIFIFVNLKESGTIGSRESSKIMKNFEKNFNSDKKTIIYYASSECSYCSLETPILETISDDYDMDYYYIDSSKLSNSDRKTVLKKLKIEHATPTTVVVKSGKIIDTAVGYLPGNEYVKFFIKAGMLKKDAVYSKEQYITFIDYNKYTEMIKTSDTHVIVVGQTTCSHCIAIKPALNTVAGDYNLKINYLNLTDMSEEESNKFFDSLKNIGYNEESFLADGSFGTPLTLIIKNGKVSSYISGERTTSQLIKEFKKLGLISE